MAVDPVRQRAEQLEEAVCELQTRYSAGQSIEELRLSYAERVAAIEAALRAERMAVWRPIDTAPRDQGYVLVALIRDGKVRRVSEAAFNGLGWYDKGSGACHWRTHWMPLPAAIEAAEQEGK